MQLAQPFVHDYADRRGEIQAPHPRGRHRDTQDTITMTREGNRLFGQMTGQGKLEFFPESDSSVFCGDVDAQLSFVRDSSGKVDYLILHQNGLDQKATKIK